VTPGPAGPGSDRAAAATPDSVRAELARWVAVHWDPDLSLREWRRLLAAAGWAAPSWPRRWHGGGMPAWADDLVGAELIRLGAAGPPVGSGMALAAPTILAHGPDGSRERFLLPILTGEQTWCQLFSEPGAGSDLAGLSTSAVADGDDWVINGQKVWTTSAHHADYGMLLARTDPAAPKHRGITYLAIPMRQPGVLVRPLRQMNFRQSFNEVFFTDARVPRGNVIGEPGGGWAAALTTLAYERRFGAMSRPAYDSGSGPSTRRGPRRPRTSRPTSGTRSGPGAPIWPPSTPGRPAAAMIRSSARRWPGCWPGATPAGGRPSGPGPRGPPAGPPAPRARSASWRPATSPARRPARTRRSPPPPGC
jgi:hypothetical protein